jgi:HEAT repeat protein
MTKMMQQDLVGRPVHDQRMVAKAMRTSPGSLPAWSDSPIREARSVAGYAMAWALLDLGQQAWATADRLIEDDDWTVREAATFGARDALITSYSTAAPCVRRWAEAKESDRAHRAFMVIARQPGRQRDDAVAEMISLLPVPLSDPAPYVRKNIAFCLHYLGRTHAVMLAEHMRRWAAEPNEYLQRACLIGITEKLALTAPSDVGEIVGTLRTSAYKSVRTKAESVVISSPREVSR